MHNKFQNIDAPSETSMFEGTLHNGSANFIYSVNFILSKLT